MKSKRESIRLRIATYNIHKCRGIDGRTIPERIASVLKFLKPYGEVLALVKPQFEVGKTDVGKGGIVRDPAKRIGALQGVEEFARGTGFQVLGSIPSPLPGAEGNQEFLLHLQL